MQLDGNGIKVVEEVRFLGVTFDSGLSFVPHIKVLREECTGALHVVGVVAGPKWVQIRLLFSIFIALLSDPGWIAVVLCMDLLELRI